MKVIGAVLMAVGLLWLVVAINMDTYVTTGGGTIGGETYGSGEYSFRTPVVAVPRQDVFNLSKAEERRTHLTLAGITLISGVVLFGFGALNGSSLSRSTPDGRKCPACAEWVKAEATICRFCSAKLEPINELVKAESSNTLQAYYATHSARQTTTPSSFAICETCRTTNDGEATTCFRCGAALTIEA